MEQKMRFGLVLGRLAILKKKLRANYEQLLRVVFSCFQGQKIILKKFKNIVVSSAPKKASNEGEKTKTEFFKIYILNFYLPKSCFRILILYLESILNFRNLNFHSLQISHLLM
jgi:hypothetical protein